MYKKIIILLLAASMAVCPVMSSCSEKENSDSSADTKTSEMIETSETETAEESVIIKEIKDDLPEMDLDGMDYRIKVFWSKPEKTFSEELNGETVNDAIYNKVAAVEERFNVNITCTGKDEDLQPEDVQNEILSSENTFEIVQGHDGAMGEFSLEGYFLNLLDLPYFDFDAEWWPVETVKSLSVANKMYLMSNYISNSRIMETRAWFFNKGLFDNMGIEYPYQAVYDGKWTLDYMNSLIKGAYFDSNGNSEVDMDDRFGIVNEHWYGWLEPFNVDPYKKDDDGLLYYEFDYDKITSLMQKFYNMMFGGESLVKYGIPEGARNTADMFADNQAMFIYDVFERINITFMDSDVQFGILPMPKFDENQDKYYAGCTDYVLAIPVTVPKDKIDSAALISEALNIEGYRQVYPAYFEYTLKDRYSDAGDDAKMIDIIVHNSIFSFSYLYGNKKNVPYYIMINDLFNPEKPSTDVVSYAKKAEKVQKKHAAKFNEFFLGE